VRLVNDFQVKQILNQMLFRFPTGSSSSAFGWSKKKKKSEIPVKLNGELGTYLGNERFAWVFFWGMGWGYRTKVTENGQIAD